MKFYTYIIYSPSWYEYYIDQGHEHPENTLHRHNSGKSICTKKGAPWQLVFSQQFETSCEAYILKQKLQNMKSRKLLKYFIDHLPH